MQLTNEQLLQLVGEKEVQIVFLKNQIKLLQNKIYDLERQNQKEAECPEQSE